MYFIKTILTGCLLLFIAMTVKADTPHWFANNHFRISGPGHAPHIRIDKMPWESFSVEAGNYKAATISFILKAQDAVTLRVDGYTSKGEQVKLFNKQIEAGAAMQLQHHFSVPAAAITQLIFYVNPGKPYTGEVWIEDFEVKPVAFGQELISLYPNPGNAQVQLTSIAGPITEMCVTDNTGRIIFRSSPNSARVILDVAAYKQGLYFIKSIGPALDNISKLVVTH